VVFSVVDVVSALTDSANPTDYLKKLRKRDALLGEYLGTHCPQVAMQSTTGPTRKILAATAQQLLRIVQSIPITRNKLQVIKQFVQAGSYGCRQWFSWQSDVPNKKPALQRVFCPKRNTASSARKGRVVKLV
jgi:hypothetical protein